MYNKKINKSIFTGLAAVTLFAPMALHNTQANADSSSTSQVRTTLQNDSFNNLVQGATNLNPSTMNEGNINNVFNSLKNFANTYQSLPGNLKSLQTNQYQSIQDLGRSPQYSQLESAIKSVDGVDQSNKNIDDVINTGASLNRVAGDLKGISFTSKDTSSLQAILKQYKVQSVNFNDGHQVATSSVDNGTVRSINSIKSVTFDNGQHTTLTLYNVDGMDSLPRSIGNAIKSAKVTRPASTRPKKALSKEAGTLQAILKQYKVQSVNFNDGHQVATNSVDNDTVNNINNTQSITFNNSKHTTLNLQNANSVYSLPRSIDNAIKSAKQQAASQNNNASDNNTGFSVVAAPTSSNNSSNTNSSNYQAPSFNEDNQTASFPAAPVAHKSSTHKATNHKAKISTKQLKKDKNTTEKAKKNLRNVKKQLKKAKGKNKRAKINNELKKAKKAFAQSEVQLNHAKHATK